MRRESATVCVIKSPALEDTAGLSLVERLRLLPDPRRRRGVRHSFVAVLLVAASAVVAGARSYAAIGHRPVVRERAAACPGPLGCPGRGGIERARRAECRQDSAGCRPDLPWWPGRSDRR
ncbi:MULTISPECIES: transposase family protein [unclassified Streptomyces]|uniref:transposase family protein n=1 Tax=unclassified Streptomyces TaxID=2593676 RepID=UPI0035D75B50